jgi:hypothetical protein
MLKELDRVVAMDGQDFGCIWLLDEVDFGSVRGQAIAGITLTPPTSPPERLVSNLLPEALWADERLYPAPFGKRAGLLHATGRGAGHHWDVTTQLNNAMYRLLQVLRLATGTTAQTQMVWIGETSMIHVDSPAAHPQGDDFPRSQWERMAKVTPEMMPGLARLMDGIHDLEQPRKRKRGQDVRSPVVVALGRFGRSYRSATWQDAVLDLATALEAALGPRSTEQEIGLTLRTRAAHLLANGDSDRAERIYRDVADLYGLRSDIIHGNPVLRKSLPSLWNEHGYDQVFEEDRTRLLLDRWRDIVRRVIAARLLLAGMGSTGQPVWDVNGVDDGVDIALIRPDKRKEWRQRIVDGASALTLPLLAEEAPPLIDYLHAADPS